ncbi:exonuclease SbcCD subunit D [Halobium palmae]|uniref:Exonuclease SbcCD subunit D n=1 Tax=Halobium palmae TaxID=1776492 RepID=A0ABD5RW03_9EURY
MSDEFLIHCPVPSCDYTGLVASVAGHVSGKQDKLHSWERLEYRGANDFKSDTDFITSLAVTQPECPVSGCSYRNTIPSIAAHVSGKKDGRHDWRRLEYDGAWDFRTNYHCDQTANPVSVLHMTDTHIGKKLGGYGSQQWPVDCVGGFVNAITEALLLNVDAVLHTGDIFHNDRHGITKEHIEACRTQLVRLRSAAIPFYYILGDHARKAGQQQMNVFETEGLACNLSESPTTIDDGLSLYGVNFHDEDWWDSPNWRPHSTERPSILALHQSMTPFTKAQRAECALEVVLDRFQTAGGPVPEIVAVGQFYRQIDQPVGTSRVICGGATERLGSTKSSLAPCVGLFRSDNGNISYQRRLIP